MQSEIFAAIKIASQGMRIQGERIKVTSENLANSATTGTTPGADPYQRKTISFKNALDREMGLVVPMVNKVGRDDADFPIEFNPDHPAADENGYVKMPNVNSLMEMMDAREAQRTYEANLGLIEQSRSMMSRTIDLLRV